MDRLDGLPVAALPGRDEVEVDQVLDEPGTGSCERAGAARPPIAKSVRMGGEDLMLAVAPFLPTPESLVTTWRRFGEFGPAYHIDAIDHVLDSGETVFLVSVPGPRDAEVLERRYSEVLADPEVG